jgi:outer membrane protein assembly factor BamB
MLLALVTPGIAHAWEAHVNGTGTFQEVAEAVVLDARGDVVSAGRFRDATRLQDFLVVKHEGVTGREVWRHWLFGDGGAGCCGTRESALAVALGPAGEIFAGGYLAFGVTPIRRASDFTVARFEPSIGTSPWRAFLNGGAGNYFDVPADMARALATDADGNVLAAGYLAVAEGPASPISEFTVVKLAGSNGGQIWRRGFQGSDSAASGFPANDARALAVDASGAVVAVGRLANAGGMDEFTVIKLAAADGEELWRRALPGSGWDVAIDSTGDVIAGGASPVPVIIKLAGTDGGTVWEETLLAPGADTGSVFDLAVDADGDVFAAGEVEGPSLLRSLLVARVAATGGEERWLVVPGGTLVSSTDLALDPTGDLVLSVQVQDAVAGEEFGVLKLAGDDGEERWRRTWNGGNVGAFEDRARALAVGIDGHVVAVGVLNSLAFSEEYTVAKLRGSDGSDLPRCGDADADDDVDIADILALRAALAAAGPTVAAPDRCSVIGGAFDCDILDVAVLVRWRHIFPPGVAGVCQAVLD